MKRAKPEHLPLEGFDFPALGEDGIYTYQTMDETSVPRTHVLDVEHLHKLTEILRSNGKRDFQRDGLNEKTWREIEEMTKDLPSSRLH